MPAATCPSLSSIFVKIRYYWFFPIIPKVFNFQCHNLSFRGSYIPPESPTKLYGILGRNDNTYEPVIGQIHPFFCLRLNSTLSSLRTCSINRCEPVAKIVANPVTPERSSPTVIRKCSTRLILVNVCFLKSSQNSLQQSANLIFVAICGGFSPFWPQIDWTNTPVAIFKVLSKLEWRLNLKLWELNWNILDFSLTCSILTLIIQHISVLGKYLWG